MPDITSRITAIFAPGDSTGLLAADISRPSVISAPERGPRTPFPIGRHAEDGGSHGWGQRLKRSG